MVSVIVLSFVVVGRRTTSDYEEARRPPAGRAMRRARDSAIGLLHHAPGHYLAPGKRPLRTIIPAMTTRNDEPDTVFGVMGGQYQAVGHVHMLMQMVDLDLDVQAASDIPRSFWENGHLTIESTVGPDVRADLEARGHRVRLVSEPIGECQAIRIDRENGVLWGASDHRKDGIALGY